MAGRPFQVGRFAHTLRVRLMREHLGIDVDAIEEENMPSQHGAEQPEEQKVPWNPDQEQFYENDADIVQIQKSRANRTSIGNAVRFGADQVAAGKFIQIRRPENNNVLTDSIDSGSWWRRSCSSQRF